MPAFAPNFTARLKVRYFAGGATHSQLWRSLTLGGGFATVDALIGEVQSYYDAIAGSIFDDWAILDVSVAAEGALIFIPHGTLTVTGLASTVGMPARAKASQISYPARTDNGNPWIVYQYGWANMIGSAVTGDDFRFNIGEDGDVDAGLAALQAMTIPVGNDGSGLNFKNYANVKYNDNWEKKVRKGA
jgi:hypothetical protein